MRSPFLIYKVRFNYRGNDFTIINQTGTAFVGTIHCKLSKTLQPIAFELDNISHLKNLFLRKKSRFKIISENKNIAYFLSKNIALQLLSEIANKENFSPSINCHTDDSWIITCKYHLEFDDWTQVIDPIIELYKNLIDEFEKRNANLATTAYRGMN